MTVSELGSGRIGYTTYSDIPDKFTAIKHSILGLMEQKIDVWKSGEDGVMWEAQTTILTPLLTRAFPPEQMEHSMVRRVYENYNIVDRR